MYKSTGDDIVDTMTRKVIKRAVDPGVVSAHEQYKSSLVGILTVTAILVRTGVVVRWSQQMKGSPTNLIDREKAVLLINEHISSL